MFTNQLLQEGSVIWDLFRQYSKSEKNKNASLICKIKMQDFRRVWFSMNSEIFFLKSNMADAGMSEGVLWLSLTVLTGPDIKTSIVKGQPNEKIKDLLSTNELLKGKQIFKRVVQLLI